MQPLGCVTEVELFCDGDEVTEMAELDIAIHMLKIIIELNKILDRWNMRAQTWVYGD